MLYRKLNIFYTLLISAITLISCNTPQGVLNSVEDDVYFSRKATNNKPVYVPEVDVNEIIKQNPPQYGEGREIQPEYQPNNYNYNSGIDYTNPNAASGYQHYKAEQDALQQEEQNNNEQFLSTVPYTGYEEEASEASLLRRQYAGNYGGYFARPSRYNRWARPLINVGWNMFTGFGVGMGWGNGFNTGWNTGYGYGWPHYNTYCDPFWTYGYGYRSPWGYNPYNNWGYNSWGYNPWGFNHIYGFNNWYGYRHHNYVGGWGNNQYERTNTPAKTYRPRGQGAGTGLPRSSDGGRVVTPRQGQVGVENPQQNQGRVVVPRSSSEGQLINRDGQPVYVAPNQNRNNTPRSYNSYPKSVEQERNYRDVAPAPRPQVPQTRPSTPRRDYTAPVQDRNETPRERRSTPAVRESAPSRDNTPARNISPSPSPSPSRGGGTVSPPSGGSRGSSGGGSVPRSRPR